MPNAAYSDKIDMILRHDIVVYISNLLYLSWFALFTFFT